MAKIQATKKMKTMMMMYYMTAKNAKHNDQKVAWITSGGPVELLQAFDIIPIYPENHAAMAGATRMGGGLAAVAEGMGYSPDLCSYFRIDVGAAETHGGPIAGLPEPDLLVCANNICKTVTKWYEIQAEKFGVPLIMVDMPFIEGDITDAEIQYVAEQLKEAVPVLEEVSGKTFDEEKFTHVLELSRDAIDLWMQCLDLCASKPAPMSSFDAFFQMAPIVTLRGDQRTVDYYRTLLAELQEMQAAGVAAVEGERHRLLFDNIPMWYAVKHLSEKLAERGAALVTATYTASWGMEKDMTEGDPWEAMAYNYLAPYINRGFETRLDTLEHLMKKFQCDGFVMHSARSCKAYSLGQYDLQEALTKRTGAPGVVIEGDIADERQWSQGQVDTRLEAFLEKLDS
ncbi:MAG: 2-hydroxyacyl-CoA dehydratase family protein [Candidatus Lernaella stagnicola]|nr:2-hydroxyacyl-CoA dehydratase family protein [Candidatus Lernaella stagnicola]